MTDVTLPNTFVSAGAAPSTTNRTDIYECPNNFKGILRYATLANTTHSTSSGKLEWYNSSETTYYALCGDLALAGDAHEDFTNIYLVLESGDKITVTAGNADRIHAIVGVELVYNPLLS